MFPSTLHFIASPINYKEAGIGSIEERKVREGGPNLLLGSKSPGVHLAPFGTSNPPICNCGSRAGKKWSPGVPLSGFNSSIHILPSSFVPPQRVWKRTSWKMFHEPLKGSEFSRVCHEHSYSLTEAGKGWRKRFELFGLLTTGRVFRDRWWQFASCISWWNKLCFIRNVLQLQSVLKEAEETVKVNPSKTVRLLWAHLVNLIRRCLTTWMVHRCIKSTLIHSSFRNWFILFLHCVGVAFTPQDQPSLVNYFHVWEGNVRGFTFILTFRVNKYIGRNEGWEWDSKQLRKWSRRIFRRGNERI